MLALGFLQKMGDDRRRNGIDKLRARIVAQKQTGKLVVLDQWNRVAVFAILHRDADAVGQKLADIDRVMRYLNGCDQSFSRDQCPGRLKLPGRQSITDDGIAGNVERRDPIEEI